MSLHELTTTVTAFGTWNEFAAAMDGGYVPTLVPQAGRSKCVKAYNTAVAELAFRLTELGYRVWQGANRS